MEIYCPRHSDEGRIQDPKNGNTGSFVPQDDGNRKPLLLLPFTLEYLVPLICEYL